MEKKLDRATLAAFLVALGVCVALGANLVIPLLIGFALFFVRGLSKRVSAGKLLHAAGRGVWQSRWVIAVLLARLRQRAAGRPAHGHGQPGQHRSDAEVGHRGAGIGPAAKGSGRRPE